jgi:predicted transcriptional regulator
MNFSQKHEAILNVLASGANVTAKQISKQAKVAGVSQRIAELRQNGYPNIYTNTAKVKGRKVSFYRLGTPTKEMRKLARKGKLALAA